VSNASVEITAGLGGFLVLFGLALVVWFLGRDLTRRLRRMRQQEALRQAELDVPAQADQRADASGRGPGQPAEGTDGSSGPVRPPQG
jgi:hypothetical protein